MWCCRPIISELRRLRQEESKFKPSWAINQMFIQGVGSVWMIVEETVSPGFLDVIRTRKEQLLDLWSVGTETCHKYTKCDGSLLSGCSQGPCCSFRRCASQRFLSLLFIWKPYSGTLDYIPHTASSWKSDWSSGSADSTSIDSKMHRRSIDITQTLLPVSKHCDRSKHCSLSIGLGFIGDPDMVYSVRGYPWVLCKCCSTRATEASKDLGTAGVLEPIWNPYWIMTL